MSRMLIQIVEDTDKACLVKNNHGHLAWMPKSWVRGDCSVKTTTFKKNNEEYETRNNILLSETGKELPDYDPEKKTVITLDDLDEIVVGVSGIRESQLVILGAWPLHKGWRERLVGQSVVVRRLELAKLSKGKYLPNERILSCVYDEPRLIKVYEEELGI